VQVRALEKAIEDGIANSQTISDFTSLPSILDALREAYQYIGSVVNNFQKLLQLPPIRPVPCRPYEEFEARLDASVEIKRPAPSDGREFYAALLEEANAMFDGLGVEYMKAAYKLQRIVCEEVLLAEEVTGAFVELHEELPGIADDEDVQATERDILAGIRETIEIKIESLKESIQSFNTKGLDMVKSLAVDRINFSDEERLAATDEVKKLWLESPPDRNCVGDFFALCLRGDAFAPCHERVSKQIGSYFDKASKAALRFKKEVLLYEVCTYEEILTHSVSRLRTSSNGTIVDAAGLLDGAFRTLEIILKKNNISVIRPNIREPFDAKQHEVLVAEKQEGFERGEIIKIVTAGYRLNDQIILRANVIAAR